MSRPNLILPESVARDRDHAMAREQAQEPPKERPRLNLPQQMIEEIRSHLEEAKRIGDAFKSLVDEGDAAQMALIYQEPIRSFVSGHLKSVLPLITQNLAHADRMQIFNYFQQIKQQRISDANLSKERVDPATYELAAHDLMALISKVPVQGFPIEVGLPDLGLDSDSQETPESENIKQGE